MWLILRWSRTGFGNAARILATRRLDWLAGHVGFELANPAAGHLIVFA
jgi:hypothetical protein